MFYAEPNTIQYRVLSTNDEFETIHETTKKLEKKTVKELRNAAKERGVTGYSDMTKSELIKALEGD